MFSFYLSEIVNWMFVAADVVEVLSPACYVEQGGDYGSFVFADLECSRNAGKCSSLANFTTMGTVLIPAPLDRLKCIN